MSTIVIDTSSVDDLAAHLRQFAPARLGTFKAAMPDIGKLFAAEIVARTGYSKRIPRSVQVLARSGSVVIRVGGSKAANAVPIENRGRGFVRHPVFEVSTWTNKNSHPAFMGPSALAKAEAGTEVLIEALDEALHEAGFE
jgi:hypothetical protein